MHLEYLELPTTINTKRVVGKWWLVSPIFTKPMIYRNLSCLMMELCPHSA